MSRWTKRANKIETREISQKECQKIYRSFQEDYRTLLMSQPSTLLGWNAEQQFMAVEGELQTALSTAQSRYEKNVGSWYERIISRVNVFVGNWVNA